METTNKNGNLPERRVAEKNSKKMVTVQVGTTKYPKFWSVTV